MEKVVMVSVFVNWTIIERLFKVRLGFHRRTLWVAEAGSCTGWMPFCQSN